MKILLTGATGFLGSHLLRALIRKGHDVTAVVRPTSDTSRIVDLSGRYKTVDADEAETAFKGGQDAVIHCATAYGRKGDSIVRVVESNVLFPVMLLDAAISYGCPYFINTDSFFCKQLPERLEKGEKLYMPDYTLSKYQFRQWGKMRADEGKISFVNLQLEHIYGSDDGAGKFIPWLEKQLRDHVESIDLTAGTQLRDFTRVEDAAESYLRVLEDLPKYRGYCSFSIGTGQATSLRRFVEQMKTDIGSDTELRFGAIPMNEREILYSVADAGSPYLIRRSGGKEI